MAYTKTAIVTDYSTIGVSTQYNSLMAEMYTYTGDDLTNISIVNS